MKLPPHHVMQATSDSVRIALHLNAADPAFRGHFPDMPVLAGVIQLDWVMQLAQLHLGVEQRAADEFQIKCRRIIPPGEALSLTLNLDRARRLLHFEYLLSEASAALGWIRVDAA